MTRPRQCRYVRQDPHATYFKPRGIPLSELKETALSVEGLEALRLADLEGLNGTEAAARMQVSRHTFGRVLREARRAVAEALAHGRALRIEGGSYAVLLKKAPSEPAREAEHAEAPAGGLSRAR